MALTCQFWVARKGRFCKFQVKAGEKFCPEHHVTEQGDRVPCPYDASHSVSTAQLTKHLKKCNARPVDQSLRPFYAARINNGDADEHVPMSESDATIGDEQSMTERVLQTASLVLPEGILTANLESIPSSSISEGQKHTLQQEVLCERILKGLGALEGQRLLVVEFGAGKGGLSSFLWERHFCAQRDAPEVTFVLVDRSNSRCKKDAKMRSSGAKVDRLFIDIADLDLDGLVEKHRPTQVVAISKHLCGAATCLTVNALKGLRRKRPELRIVPCLALCCHQLCSWEAYPNRQFLRLHGLAWNESSFDRLKSVTSWAICNIRSDNARLPEAEESESRPPKRAKTQDRQRIGWLCKRLLDEGRRLALQEGGFDSASLKEYCGVDVTLENYCLFVE